MADGEWLSRDLKEKPDGAVPLSKVKIDWPNTKAWGDGGYYARVFLNVAGREPQGTIAPEDYEKVRDELIAGLKSIKDENGQDIGTKVYRPEELYKEVRGVAPDLIVYFGDLYWRSVGHDRRRQDPHLRKRHRPGRREPRAKRHHHVGGPRAAVRREESLEGAKIIDVAPTVLEILGLPIPSDMEGKALRR